MFITQSPIAASVDDQGNKVVIPAGREVAVEDFPSEKAFERLCEIGAIIDPAAEVVTKEEVEQPDGEIEIVPELWADEDGNIPEGVKPIEESEEVDPPAVLTKKECVALLLAAEVNANGENDEELTQTGLMKHTSAELNQMDADLEK